MSDSKKPSKPTSPKLGADDIYLVVISAKERKSLTKLLGKEMLDIGPIRKDPDSEELTLHLYITETQMSMLKKEGWKLDVRDNLSKHGIQRQKEVGKGDRFKGGRIPPKGLGKKT